MVTLFDLDGTLTDSKLGIVHCTRYALDALAKPSPSEEILISFIGPSLREMFSVLLETSDKELIEKAVAFYRDRYNNTGIHETRVYDGIPEMLECSRRMVSATFVVTSKATVFAERLIKHFGFDRYFDAVYGAELDGRFDNKVDLVRHLLAKENIAPEETVLIGDRAADVLAAKANNLSSVGVLWGYGSLTELQTAGADMLCATPDEMEEHLLQIGNT